MDLCHEGDEKGHVHMVKDGNFFVFVLLFRLLLPESIPDNAVSIINKRYQ